VVGQVRVGLGLLEFRLGVELQVKVRVGLGVQS
jgi:hypothetical protein